MSDIVSLNVDCTALTATFITTIVLYVKFVICCYKQEKAKGFAGMRPKEDGKYFGLDEKGFKKLDQDTSAREQLAQRWIRVVSNDLEQVPLALLIAWASVPVARSPVAHAVLISIFGLNRVLYSVFFAYEKQPHRTYAWFFAILSVLGMIINTFVGCADLW
eukprot:c16351_g1_i1.p1 GENE.c16351_g1_i1~~c16351_g1_i1.p1  ORF type:complete len:161 (-),score=65.46 c16351_g1_i1:53-535(-)